MIPRLLTLVITVFFITMNVLLWRSEFGSGSNLGSSVPVETVWHKMLLSPDKSVLEIRHHGKKIGYGTWTPSVGEDLAAPKTLPEDILPEGMIREPSGYTIDFSGNFSIDNLTRIRFSFDLRLGTNQQWQEMSLHLMVRPSSWEVQASAAAETVRFTTDDDSGHSEQVYKFSDLQKPDKLLQHSGWPLGPSILGTLGLSRTPAQLSPSALGLKWEARNDWLKIATARMRVYRLHAQLLDRFQIVLIISPEGEILRVELPDEIVLLNDKLTIL